MTVSKNVLMALLILSYATWGGGMIAMKYAFESFTAMQVVFARVAFAGVIYLALYRLWSHIPYQKGDWKYLLAMVLFEPCLFFLCETFAMTYTTASQGGVIAACFPLCTAVAAWLFLGEKLTRKTIIAMLLAVAGVAGASLAAESSDQASNPILGNLLMVGAVLSATGYAVCVRFISRRYSFLSISAIQALGGTIVFLPFVFTTPMPVNVTMPAIGGLLYMGLGVGFLVYLSFNFALKHLEAGIVALFGNLIPVFTLSRLYHPRERPRWLKPRCRAHVLGVIIAALPENNGTIDRGEPTPTLSPPLQPPASLTATKPINGFFLSATRHVLSKRSLHHLLPNQSIFPLFLHPFSPARAFAFTDEEIILTQPPPYRPARPNHTRYIFRYGFLSPPYNGTPGVQPPHPPTILGVEGVG
ncbi:MAG: DMT family transporter, partial [Bilophila wadsworthia]